MGKEKCMQSFSEKTEGKRPQGRLRRRYGTIGQKWPQYKGLSPTPLAIIGVDIRVT
jgi:hypothetical protein